MQYFKDDVTAFNNKKRGTITGKGGLNNRISEFLMSHLQEAGIPTHFARRLGIFPEGGPRDVRGPETLQ